MSDAAYCQQVVFRHARTFALASRMLPREKRRGAYAVYAFCRTADDIVDLESDGSRRGEALARLQSLRAAYRAAADASSVGPILREFRWAIDRFGVPRESLEALLTGVERDLRSECYHAWNDLRRYCHEVASSVGEMCTAVFGVIGGAAERELALGHARTLGVAMQLTNILRDVGEDARCGRCYLPEEDLARFSLTREEVIAAEAHHRVPEWSALMAFEIARARQLYREAIPGIALLAHDAQPCTYACAAGYASILDAIERNGFDTITRRAVVGPVVRARVFIRSWRRLAPDLPVTTVTLDSAARASHATA